VQFLERPSLFDEFDGKPVEQLRMRRGFALIAEVLRRLDEPASEECLPCTVHRDTRGERMVWRDEPSREGEAVGRHAIGQRRQYREHARLDLVCRLRELAAVMDEGGSRISGGTLAHHERGDACA
jgi:hypothetical protein